jgi:hypothetical protein
MADQRQVGLLGSRRATADLVEAVAYDIEVASIGSTAREPNQSDSARKGAEGKAHGDVHIAR